MQKIKFLSKFIFDILLLVVFNHFGYACQHTHLKSLITFVISTDL